MVKFRKKNVSKTANDQRFMHADHQTVNSGRNKDLHFFLQYSYIYMYVSELDFHHKY